MTEENTTPETTAEPQDQKVDLDYGFTIGVQKDGALFWQLHGQNQGAVQLFGLHALARKQIETMVDANMGGGLAQVMTALGAVFKAVDDVKQAVDPKPEPEPSTEGPK